MRLPEAVIQSDRAVDRCLCQGQRLLSRKLAVALHHYVRLGEAHIGQRVGSVLLNRLLKILDGSLDLFFGPFVPVIAPLEVKLIGFATLRVAFRQALFLFSAQLQPQALRDLAGDFLL